MKKKNCGYRRKLFVSLIAVVLTSLFSSAVFAQEGWKTWVRNDELVEETKVWTITFNQPVDASSVNEETVYIENEDLERIPIVRTVSPDLCSIKVSPYQGKYKAGEKYTLFVRRILSKEKTKVQKSAIKMPFRILKADPMPHNYPQQKQEMLDLINEERVKAGVVPLEFCEELFDYADIRAQELVEKFSHTRPNGNRAVKDILILYSLAAENIACGNSTAAETMDQFMNSPGHQRNILHPKLKQVAIGYHYDPDAEWKYYWVQLFVTPR